MGRISKQIWSLLLMGVLLGILVYGNSRSPRINVNEMDLFELQGDILVLLEGGETVTDAGGKETYRFTLLWEGDGCLFAPRADGTTLLVNGVERNDFGGAVSRSFRLVSEASPAGIYEVVVVPKEKTLEEYDRCVYLGTVAAVNTCLSRQTISRYLVTGICISILLFAAVLFTWKRSEKYLFWLTMCALLQIIRTLDIFGPTLPPAFEILYYLLRSYLTYRMLKYYLSMKLFGCPVILFIFAAGIVQLAEFALQGSFVYTIWIVHIVFYVCQIACILKDRHISAVERQTLLTAWVFAVSLWIFSELGQYGLIPHGDLDLQIWILPVQSAVDIIAFFIVACRRFAIKFQEADDLNAHLEAIIQEKTKEQTAFIRSMLHNLKTPLFSLVGYTDMAAESMNTDPAEAERFLSKVSGKAQYVSGMLDHLFLLTQMDADQIVFQRVPVRLDELLRAVEESARLKGKEKDAAVSLAAPKDAFCTGDPLYLQQAFQNIADNAVEHVGPGGRLDIAVAGAAEGWRITFTDNGCGILPEELPKIFDRYYSHRRGGRSSSGLGLTIAKEIVEHHGGAITVQSRPEQGAVFTVALPYPEKAEPGGAEKT